MHCVLIDVNHETFLNESVWLVKLKIAKVTEVSYMITYTSGQLTAFIDPLTLYPMDVCNNNTADSPV